MLFRKMLFALVVAVLAISGVFAQNIDENFDKKELDKLVEEEFGKFIYNTDQAKMVENIGKKIAQYVYNSQFDLTFKLIDNDEPNAFAFPNGNMYVLKGLFKTVDSENELAFVLAHEISHVLLRHSTKAEEYKNRFNISDHNDHVMKAFTREQEYEADKYGILYAIRAGYSPLGSVNWFNKMTTLGYEYPPLYVDYSDHPNFTQRVVQAFINIGTYYEYAKQFDYGMLYLSMGNYAEAAQSFEKFLEKYPHYKEAYNNIGVALLIQQLSEKNIQLDLWLSTATSKVQLFADNFDKPVRGNYTFASSEFSKAMENFQKAIQYDKTFEHPYINMALISILTRDFSKAKNYLDQALKMNKKSYEAYLTLGFLYTEQNDYKMAADAFKKAVEIDKDNPMGIYDLAMIYQWNAQKDLAIATWNRFLEVMPEGDYANQARENLAALQTGEKGQPKDKEPRIDYADNTSVNASIAGVSIGDNMATVKMKLKSPDKKSYDQTGEVWEYLSPNITIGFTKEGLVDYVLVFDALKTGLEFVKNVNVGATTQLIIQNFGRPEASFQDGQYTVFNYQSLGLAFWILNDRVVGIGIYSTR